jgi:hypothetical protein
MKKSRTRRNYLLQPLPPGLKSVAGPLPFAREECIKVTKERAHRLIYSCSPSSNNFWWA